MRLFYNFTIVLIFFLVFVVNLLICALSCSILSFFSFFILAKYIFSKIQITLLVFPLSCRLCPKFRALLIVYNSKISFVVLQRSITFESDFFSVRRISLNFRNLINSLPVFYDILFELIHI